MMKISKLFKALMVFCLFFVASSLFPVHANAAPKIYFDPASQTVQQGADTQINVKIDVGSTSIFGADAVINYPASDFTVKSVSYGGFFSDTVTPIQNQGQIIIRGSFFSSTTGVGSGSGTFAIITLNSNKNSGTSNMTFACSGSGNDTDIIDSNGNNVLTCNNLNQSTLTFSTSTSTDTGTSTGSQSNPTNACGGTCGSNYNCNSGLFCYQGFCRNPDCQSSTSCSCALTPSPSPTVKPTIRPTTKPTPAVVTLSKFTPIPTFEPSASPSPSPTTQKQAGFDIKSLGVWGAIIAIAAVVIIMAVNALKKKNSPPKINPPTGQTEPLQTYHVSPPISNEQQPGPYTPPFSPPSQNT